MSRVSELRAELDRDLADYRLACDLERRESAELDACRAAVSAAGQAQEVVQACAQEVQQRAHAQVGRVVSQCLSSVYGGAYGLKINFTRKRGRTEADFIYTKGSREVDPRVDSGGVLDVSSLALRVCRLSLGLPPLRPLLVLDEPFRAVEKKKLPLVGEMLQVLARDMQIQVIVVTHDPELQVGRVIELSQDSK